MQFPWPVICKRFSFALCLLLNNNQHFALLFQFINYINLLVWILVWFVSLFDASAVAILSLVLAKCVVRWIPALTSLLWLLLLTFIKNVFASSVSLLLLLLVVVVLILPWLNRFDAWLPIIVEQLLKKYSKTWKFTLYRIFINFYSFPLPLATLDGF